MKIIEKIKQRAEDNAGYEGITIAFLGDSVTQGCFELYMKTPEVIETIFDRNNAYHAHLSKILALMYPSVPVNIINAGISGGNAVAGYERLERDVLRHKPDLVVVCFGLNDFLNKESSLDDYAMSLDNIFKAIQKEGAEIIFMTPNMCNDRLSPHLSGDLVIDMAKKVMECQQDGYLDMYISKAKEVCKNNSVVVCDCYKKWKQLQAAGVDVTELLANKINHPLREMNWLFAYSLLETMISE